MKILNLTALTLISAMLGCEQSVRAPEPPKQPAAPQKSVDSTPKDEEPVKKVAADTPEKKDDPASQPKEELK